MPDFPQALPHTSFEEVFPDVFMVRGSFDMKPLMRITRNMIVVREGQDLTLINTVRLSDAGEKELEALGEVKNIVRIGTFHGADDPYFRHRYSPKYWTQKGQQGALEGAEELSEGHLPIEAELFEFNTTRRPEAILRLDAGGGTLVSCDGVQNFVDTAGCSLLAKAAVTMMGFKFPSNVGGPWRKAMTHRDKPLIGDFDRLMALDFKHLISAHGPVNRDTAKTDLKTTLERLF